MKGKRLVVTGGAGFIGSHLVDALSRDNSVTVIDDFSRGKEENLEAVADRISIVRGSITDAALLLREFDNVHAVFHLAAITGVQESIDNPIGVNRINVGGTLNILTAARDSGVERVVLASSASVYGDDPTLPQKESTVPRPMSPYAVTKMVGEHYCRVFHSVYGLKTSMLRFFNVYGPRQDPESQYAAVVPKFVTLSLQNKPPVIYGDGLQTRDFIYVEDVARALVLAVEKEDAVAVPMNVAGGCETSVLDLAKTIIELAGSSAIPIHDAPMKGEVRRSAADVGLAEKLLGFSAACSLEDGLKKTLEYYK